MNLLLQLASFAILFGFLLVAMVIHEFAHSWTAYKLGDTTAKYSGRLTLNPLAHIDVFWSVLIPLILFITTGFFIAAAKPVPINYWALRNPRRDMVLIGASGPLSNLLLAVLLSVVFKMLPGQTMASAVFANLIYINVMLGVFNLVPVPPLDGSRVVMGLLPPEMSQQYSRIEPYGLVIVTALFFSGVLFRVIWPIITSLMAVLGVPLTGI